MMLTFSTNTKTVPLGNLTKKIVIFLLITIVFTGCSSVKKDSKAGSESSIPKELKQFFADFENAVFYKK